MVVVIIVVIGRQVVAGMGVYVVSNVDDIMRVSSLAWSNQAAELFKLGPIALLRRPRPHVVHVYFI